MKTGGNHKQHIALRPFGEADFAAFDRFGTEPEAAGAFRRSGFVDSQALRRRFAADGLLGATSSAVAVVVDDAVAGMATWEAADRGGPVGGCYEIGVTLLPDHRGHGVGTRAHQLLAEHLFRFTSAHRLEAFTDTENLAVQRVLEKTGFHREGLLCQATWRDGTYRDAIVYGLLRSEA
ncbi:GNAT family N-acetyltransferase [Amycolatopsis jiangsuensis]|uniref:RimJ/RimL family protein N-acetyltransferase n=1 Tax=Amycolatopsis jiangsuensis TaxID=1181879 RepID=A0A840IV06_9PSEU|nr:GNAT family protein [Amycolatopsis jiangsuensis]MBB4686346.1 RimJ/RimL family protein N-acetyltransferase [Amycolatopsis jiangsuensis]